MVASVASESAEQAKCPAAISVSDADLAQAEAARPERIARIRRYLAARAAAAKGDREAALAAMHDLAAKGANVLPGPQDPLAQYLGDTAFAPVLGQLRARIAATANGRLATEVSGPPVAAESISYDAASRRYFLSNWFDNAIYTLWPGGRLVKYFALPDLTPNGIAVDSARHRLWFVATNAFREGAPEPKSRLWRVDLLTGAKSSFEGEGAKGFNDLAIAPNGDVFVTDTPGNALYVLPAGARQLQRFLPDERFQQPNGISVGEDGRFLFVAQGMDLLRVDLRRRDVTEVQVPAAVETMGTDSLRFRDGRLFAVQNLFTPGTVVELTLDGSRTKTTAYRFLDAANPLFDLPTSGAFAGNDFYVIAGTQLYRYGRDKKPAASEIKPLRLLAYRLCN